MFHMRICYEGEFPEVTALPNRWELKLGAHTPNSHGLSRCGRHFKDKTSQEEKEKWKEIYHSLVYIIQSAILNQHLSVSKEKKNTIYKTVNKEQSGYS